MRKIINLFFVGFVGLATFAEPIAVGGLLVIMTAYLVDGSFNPFLYFRF